MKFYNLLISIFTSLILSFSISNADVGTDFNELIKKNHDLTEYPFLESRNDIGIFYDFTFDKDKKRIIIKRDIDNYPVVRFSLFDKVNIKPKDIVISYNNIDLSKLNDEEIRTLHKKREIVYLKISDKKNIPRLT